MFQSIIYRFFFLFFGDTLLNHPDLFEGKFLKDYPFFIQNLNTKEVYEMESYIIENYCAFQDEKLEISFLGKIRFKDIIIEGRIYFTNVRIFTIGTARIKARGASSSLVSATIQSQLTFSLAKKYRRKFMRHGKEEYQEVPSFGYLFPLYKARKISNKEKLMKFITYSYNNEAKAMKFSIKVLPAQYLKETKQEFLSRVEELFSTIQKILHDLQTFQEVR